MVVLLILTTMKHASIRDIADRLGVSKALVSFVLNGKGEENRISRQMIDKVLGVAREMNYKPNQVAKWFRTGKTQTFGLIIADISNPFFGRLGREIEREASRKGYKIILCSSDENPEKSGEQLEMLIKSQVDGLIIAPPGGSNAQIESLSKMKIPYVLIDRYFSEIDSNYIIIDNYAASYRATSHLLNKGYRKIAYLAINDELITMHNRTEGFLQAMRDAGIGSPENNVVYLPFSHEKKDVGKAIRQLLSVNKRVEGIFFSSSKIGLMGLEVITESGVKVPDDLVVVSFDDPDYFKICFSPVTAIAQPLEKMGRKAVQILVREIESGKSGLPSKKIVMETNFIIRKSSG
jgi:LacI family transcriptional regulator